MIVSPDRNLRAVSGTWKSPENVDVVRLKPLCPSPTTQSRPRPPAHTTLSPQDQEGDAPGPSSLSNLIALQAQSSHQGDQKALGSVISFSQKFSLQDLETPASSSEPSGPRPGPPLNPISRIQWSCPAGNQRPPAQTSSPPPLWLAPGPVSPRWRGCAQ